MSTKLRLKTRSKHKPESPRRYPRHTHLEDCHMKQKEIRNRKREYLSRKVKLSLTKLADKNVIDVIKSISGSSHGSSDSYLENAKCRISRRESESSVIYVGTTYLKTEMPRQDSIIDLTKSDTTMLSQWANNYNLETYDISGDNVIDELHLKDQASSAASICTIFPPQPPSLFSSPSDELCVCQSDHRCCILSLKRNLSASDISCCSNANKTKRVASSRSRLSDKMDTDSSDCIWKLKKSYPLTNRLCSHKKDAKSSAENMDVDGTCDINISEIAEDLEKEFNISNSQHSALAGELKALKVASILDSNVTNV